MSESNKRLSETSEKWHSAGRTAAICRILRIITAFLSLCIFVYIFSKGLVVMVGASRISIDTHIAWLTLAQNTFVLGFRNNR